MERFSTRIKELRKQHNLTQEQLGQVIDVSKYSILLYEKGKNYPDVRGLIGLADYFGVSTDYLLGRTDDKSGARNLISEDSVISQLSRRDRQVLLRVAEGLHAASVQKQEAMKSSRTQKIVPPADVKNAR